MKPEYKIKQTILKQMLENSEPELFEILTKLLPFYTESQIAAAWEAAKDWRQDYVQDFREGEEETEIRTDEVEFAVVARRWPDALSLNDLQSRCYYVGEFCQTAADARSESTAEDAAKSFIYEAKRNLDAKLRNRSWQDGQLRPTLVYDQRLLRQTWTLEAIAVVLLSASKSATDQDGTFSLYQEFRRLADEAWNNLGEIRYDADDSGLPDTKVRPGVRFWSR